VELCFNDRAGFTRWIVKRGLLQEPFVVVDVGVQGGASPRWDLLGDHLEFHGFDAIAEVIGELQQRNQGRPKRHFYNIALGDADGRRQFYVNLTDRFSSSMFGNGAAASGAPSSEQVRTVAVRRLDGLFREGLVSGCDFLKVDVEGFEKHVLLGARELLAAGVLGVEAETSLAISAEYPKGHLNAMIELVQEHRLLPIDLAFNRIPRASFLRAVKRKGVALHDEYGPLGPPRTFNVLFCRNPIAEADAEAPRPARLSVDQVIKVMMICELHGLNDVAVDIAERFAEELGRRLDVEQAIALLADPKCRLGSQSETESVLLHRRIRALEESTSWRVTAPLRGLKHVLRWAGRIVRD